MTWTGTLCSATVGGTDQARRGWDHFRRGCDVGFVIARGGGPLVVVVVVLLLARVTVEDGQY